MRNKHFFLVLAGALVFGLLAAVSVTRYLSSAQAYTKSLNRVAVAKVAIPLGPHREFSVGEIQRVDRRSSLPPIVWKRIETSEWIGVVDRVSQPPA